MNGKLLDTNVLVRLFNGDKKITNYLLKQNDIRLSSISLGELLFGAEKSWRTEEKKARPSLFFRDTTFMKLPKKSLSNMEKLNLRF